MGHGPCNNDIDVNKLSSAVKICVVIKAIRSASLSLSLSPFFLDSFLPLQRIINALSRGLYDLTRLQGWIRNARVVLPRSWDATLCQPGRRIRRSGAPGARPDVLVGAVLPSHQGRGWNSDWLKAWGYSSSLCRQLRSSPHGLYERPTLRQAFKYRIAVADC